MFSRIGAGGFAEWARHELGATGETVRERAAAAANQELTAQEAQIVRLARHGLSTPEIGARLFLSPRTVQYYLGNVFAKPGIGSRSQLDGVGLPGGRVAVWQPGPAARIAAGPGPAAHWPVALDTGGYEPAPAGTTLHVKKPPARRAPGAAAAGAASWPPGPAYWRCASCRTRQDRTGS
jgi:DNA-binding CsgD family transcriptional regulator